MKIVHISTYRTGGAGCAAWRLHEALLRQGYDSSFISFEQQGPAEKKWFRATGYGSRLLQLWLRRGWPLLRAVQEILQGSGLTRLRLTRLFGRLSGSLGAEHLSLPYSRYALHRHPVVQAAHVVHLHWVAQGLDYPSFFASVRVPIVWTLHDLNPLLGIFHYTLDAEKCLPRAARLEAACRRVKQQALHRSRCPVHYIAPSGYFYRFATTQGIAPQQVAAIPYTGIAAPAPVDRPTLRQQWGYSPQEPVALVVASDLGNHRKGMDLLAAALPLCSTPFKLLAVGAGAAALGHLPQVQAAGYVATAHALQALYSMCDVLILPSREDNLPNVMLEAFACGLPVVAFATGGMPDYVQDSLTGVLGREVSAAGLAKAIDRFWQGQQHYHADTISRHTAAYFAEAHIVAQHVEWYQKASEYLKNDAGG